MLLFVFQKSTLKKVNLHLVFGESNKSGKIAFLFQKNILIDRGRYSKVLILSVFAFYFFGSQIYYNKYICFTPESP